MRNRGHPAHCQHRCRWSFKERAKPAISFGVKKKSDFSYMNGGTDGEGGSLYGMVLLEPEPVMIERKPHKSGNVLAF